MSDKIYAVMRCSDCGIYERWDKPPEPEYWSCCCCGGTDGEAGHARWVFKDRRLSWQDFKPTPTKTQETNNANP